MKPLLLLITLSFLPTACAPFRGVSGEFTGRNGIVRVHPDGRFEVIIEPTAAK
jgi:hypothetical protein